MSQGLCLHWPTSVVHWPVVWLHPCAYSAGLRGQLWAQVVPRPWRGTGAALGWPLLSWAVPCGLREGSGGAVPRLPGHWGGARQLPGPLAARPCARQWAFVRCAARAAAGAGALLAGAGPWGACSAWQSCTRWHPPAGRWRVGGARQACPVAGQAAGRPGAAARCWARCQSWARGAAQGWRGPAKRQGSPTPCHGRVGAWHGGGGGSRC